MNTIEVNVSDLPSANIGENEIIKVTGTPTGSVKCYDAQIAQWNNSSVVDLSNIAFPVGTGLLVRRNKNIIIKAPVVDMGEIDNSAISFTENNDSVVLYGADTTRGANGIKLSDGTQNTIVYRSESREARIDGMQCHAKYTGVGLTGDRNAFIECISGALTENGFDMTSGENHYIIDCKVLENGHKNGVGLGHDCSLTIINLEMPDYKIMVKNVKYLKVMGSNVRSLTIRSKANDGVTIPQNVEWFGRRPKVENYENLDLDGILSFRHASEGYIPGNIRNFFNERLNRVHEIFQLD